MSVFRRLIAAACVAAGVAAALLSVSGGGAASASPQAVSGDSSTPVPPELAVPEGNTLTARFAASGVQVYRCTSGAWVFVEPAAALYDRYGRTVAIHFRGPSWESIRDGSLVEGSVVASVPVTGSIPQLLLRATTTRGTGVFGGVSYIQRLATTGGTAPAGSCTEGETRGVPYTAVYQFYKPTA
jgi:hypothetical protein